MSTVVAPRGAAFPGQTHRWGPLDIAVDATRGRVYTDAFTGQTFAIDVAQRAIVET